MASAKYVTVKLPIDIASTEIGEKLDRLMEFVATSHDLLIKRLGELETMVYNNVEELRSDFNDATNDLARRWKDQVDNLKADLAEALANDDGVDADAEERVKAAVQATLDSLSDLPAKLRALGADSENPVPDAEEPTEGSTDGPLDSNPDQSTETDSTGGQTSGDSEPDINIDSPPPDAPIETPQERLNP